jgi:hypothetical protein
MDGLFRDAETVWERYGRPGRPRLVAQVNVALGPPGTVEEARRHLLGYYAFTGRADYVVNGLLTTVGEIRAAVEAFTGIGADEVMLYCWSSDPDQVDRLAEAFSV